MSKCLNSSCCIFQLQRFSDIKVKGDELFKESMKLIYEGILASEGEKEFRSKWQQEQDNIKKGDNHV